MYEDKKMKLQVYRDIIKKQLIKQGEYPRKEMVDSLVNNIDTRYAILDHYTITENSGFDIDRFNTDLYSLYHDLLILYKVVYNLESKKYIELESMINGYLSSLEEVANACEVQTKLQTESTSLGNTIYFAAGGYNLSFLDKKAIVNIGSLTIEDRSQISCFVTGSGFSQEKVVFSFDKKNVSPYTVDNNVIYADGEIKTNTYEYKLNNSEQIAKAFLIPSITADERYSYIAYGGKGAIMVSGNSKEIVLKENSIPVSIYRRSKIRFFLKDASYIAFDFSAAPITKNFTGYKINGLSGITEIAFECEAGTSFDFKTDGTSYATKEIATVYGEGLYIAKYSDAKDFLIYEYIPVGSQTYKNVKMTIYDVDYDSFKIDSIAVKQLSAIKRLVEI